MRNAVSVSVIVGDADAQMFKTLMAFEWRNVTTSLMLLLLLTTKMGLYLVAMGQFMRGAGSCVRG